MRHFTSQGRLDSALLGAFQVRVDSPHVRFCFFVSRCESSDVKTMGERSSQANLDPANIRVGLGVGPVQFVRYRRFIITSDYAAEIASVLQNGDTFERDVPEVRHDGVT